MNKPKPNTASPFAKPQSKSGVRISIATMLLLLVIFAIVFAAIAAAFQIPAIRTELAAFFGQNANANTGAGSNRRASQFLFVMLCYSAPLLLAAILNTGLCLIRFITKSGESDDSTPSSPFDDE